MIIVGVVALLFLRENLARGIAVFTGRVDLLMNPSVSQSANVPTAVTALTYLLPAALIIVGSVTLIRAHFASRTTDKQ